jgi:hypothetical protein
LVGVETEQVVPESGGPQHPELVHEAAVATAAQIELGAGYRLAAGPAQFFMRVVVTAHPDVVVAINRHGAGMCAHDAGVIDDAFVVRGADVAVGIRAAATRRSRGGYP